MPNQLQKIPMWNLPRYMNPGTPPFVPGQVPTGGAPPSRPPMGSNAPAWMQKIQGGMGKMFGMGQPNPYLSPQEQQAAEQQQRMAIIASLLQSARPVPKGTSSPLGGIGTAIQAGQQSNQQFTAEAMRARMVQAQMEQANQGRAEPAAIREMQAMGLDPTNPTDRQTYADWKGASKPADPNAAAISDLQKSILEQRAAEGARTAADTERTTEATGNRKKTTIGRGLEQSQHIVDSMQKVEETFLQVGVPGAEWRRKAMGGWAGLKALFGGDASAESNTLAAFDTLKKDLNDQIISLVSTGDLGEATNAKLQAARDSMAGVETSPGAILNVQARVMQTLLDEAKDAGVEVENRAGWESLINEYKGMAEPQTEAVVPTASSIATWDLNQINEFDWANIPNTPEGNALIDAAMAQRNKLK